MSSQKSGFGCLSFIGVTSLLLIGGWYIHQQGWLGKKLTPIEGAKVIPNEAIVTSFISSEPKNWSKLEQLDLPETANIKETLDNLQQEFPESTAINYQQDIQPWLGGIMMAVLPQQSSVNDDNSILLVLGIKNKLKARDFLKKIQKESQQDWQESKYKGIKITSGKTANDKTINSALLGNNLVLADNQQTVKQAIDTYKGEPSLASEPQAKQVLSQQIKLDNSLAQVYFTDFDYLITEIAQQDISAAALAQLQQLESVIIGIGTDKQAIHIRSITNLKSNQNNLNIASNRNKILNKVPNNTIAIVNGQKLNQAWSTAVKQLEVDDNLRRIVSMSRASFKFSTKLDLDRDIFGWMDGEFLLGLMVTDRAIIPGLGIGLEPIIILETSKPKVAATTLSTIEKTLQRSVGILPQPKQTANKNKITEWQIPRSNFSLTYGWLNKNYLVLTVGNSFFESIDKSAKNPLNKKNEFKAIAQNLPDNNLGYFYVDMNQTMSIINKLPANSIDITPEAREFLNSLQGIGATATMPDKLTSQLDVLVLFK